MELIVDVPRLLGHFFYRSEIPSNRWLHQKTANLYTRFGMGNAPSFRTVEKWCVRGQIPGDRVIELICLAKLSNIQLDLSEFVSVRQNGTTRPLRNVRRAAAPSKTEEVDVDHILGRSV